MKKLIKYPAAAFLSAVILSSVPQLASADDDTIPICTRGPTTFGSRVGICLAFDQKTGEGLNCVTAQDGRTSDIVRLKPGSRIYACVKIGPGGLKCANPATGQAYAFTPSQMGLYVISIPGTFAYQWASGVCY